MRKQSSLSNAGWLALTLKTHALSDWAGATFLTIKARSASAYRDLIGAFVRFYADHLFNPQIRTGARAFIFAATTHFPSRWCRAVATSPSAEVVWQPFLDWIAASPQDISCQGRR